MRGYERRVRDEHAVLADEAKGRAEYEQRIRITQLGLVQLGFQYERLVGLGVKVPPEIVQAVRAARQDVLCRLGCEDSARVAALDATDPERREWDALIALMGEVLPCV